MAPRVAEGYVLRLISGTVIGVPAIAAIVFGSPYFDLLIALAALALAWEWATLCGEGRFEAKTGAALILGSLAAILLGALRLPAPALLAVAIGFAVTYAVARVGRHGHAGLVAFGALYIGLPGVAFGWMRHVAPDGLWTVLWMFLAVAATDIGAFAVGKTLGGPKLAPRISPKKTWSGLTGGAALAAAVGAAMAWGLGGRTPAGVGVGALAGASAVLALVSQAGDLGESAVKRHFGVKDMSAIIPGHGGVFDRVDGHIAAAVLIGAVGLVFGGEVLAWR